MTLPYRNQFVIPSTVMYTVGWGYTSLLVLIICQANLLVKNIHDPYDQDGLLELDLVV